MAATPHVFSKDGDDDCVVVSGDVDFSAPDEIRFIYNEQLLHVRLRRSFCVLCLCGTANARFVPVPNTIRPANGE